MITKFTRWRSKMQVRVRSPLFTSHLHRGRHSSDTPNHWRKCIILNYHRELKCAKSLDKSQISKHSDVSRETEEERARRKISKVMCAMALMWNAPSLRKIEAHFMHTHVPQSRFRFQTNQMRAWCSSKCCSIPVLFISSFHFVSSSLPRSFGCSLNTKLQWKLCMFAECVLNHREPES